LKRLTRLPTYVFVGLSAAFAVWCVSPAHVAAQGKYVEAVYANREDKFIDAKAQFKTRNQLHEELVAIAVGEWRPSMPGSVPATWNRGGLTVFCCFVVLFVCCCCCYVQRRVSTVARWQSC